VIRLQMRFHSHNISFSALENYKYTIHWNCCMLLWIPYDQKPVFVKLSFIYFYI
jgi:hypothetical protein